MRTVEVSYIYVTHEIKIFALEVAFGIFSSELYFGDIKSVKTVQIYIKQ